MSLPKPTLALTSLHLALLVLAGCTSGDAAPSGTKQAPRMEHIHGIDVDPADGDVYVGTHHGLFRVDDDGPELVGGHGQDFMGFTVAGPGHFLASGHPGEGQGGPGSVGLIESTDAGETWSEVSLGGGADFHALEYRHDRVYGLNSMTGQLLVSEDQENWEELTRTLMADFAVDPGSPDALIATTQGGLARSTDSGRTFEVLSDAPLLVLVSWADDGTVVGVTPEGAVYLAEDPAGEWTERGRLPGHPEALTAISASEIYAAAVGKVMRSKDEGTTFSELG
ncbi:F510_1955 family glycosylhydrolase [Myceligenerans crystallogenes]|uniref:BNR/Asp-box repeat-containing protein n=1 Tax=Myceligenerans crystallogenes TaxID=316335 RepID=A0ABN2NEI1_9MICO